MYGGTRSKVCPTTGINWNRVDHSIPRSLLGFQKKKKNLIGNYTQIYTALKGRWYHVCIIKICARVNDRYLGI